MTDDRTADNITRLSPLNAPLRASLALVEGRTEGASNPLREADPASMEELYDRINAKLAAGMPEAITDDDLLPVVNDLIAQRARWQREQTTRAAAGPRRSGRGAATPSAAAKTLLDACDLDI